MKKSEKPKISIIVPIYNTERYLSRCIDSILGQSFKDFELLLIDDGSKNVSGAICDEYAVKDKRVRVFHQENQGVSVARNVGLENAKGEWIYFPDSDDVIMQGAFEMMMQMVNERIDFVMCGYEVYDEDGECTYSIVTRKQMMMNKKDALMEMFAPTDYRYQGYLWNKLFKASIIRDNHLAFVRGIKFNEDRLLNVEYLCLIHGDVAYTTAPIYQYTERSTGAMASLTQRFNPYFLTDLDAFVKMGEALRVHKVGWSLRKAHLRDMQSSATRMYSICRMFGELNLGWYYKIESRIWRGCGGLLYMMRLVAKIYVPIKKLIIGKNRNRAI